jgi:hypothetical protein
LKRDIDHGDDLIRAKRPLKLPVVFSSEEVRNILMLLEGVKWLMAALRYGSGLRARPIIK